MRSFQGSIFSLLFALFLAGAPAPPAAAEMVSADADAARPFVVKVHADWCGTCQALNPTWDALHSELGDGARLVILDVTDRERLAASEAEARRLGLEAFFATYRAKTGTVGVLRGDTRAAVEVMKGVTDVAPYQSAVEAAVAAARSGDPS